MNGRIFRSLEDELREDLLHPGRARLAPAGNDDIVISEGKVVPSCRIYCMVLKLGSLDGPLEGLLCGCCG